MRILFICFSTLEFDVHTPLEQPLGGTESAICYLAMELAKVGHDVSLMRNTKVDDTGRMLAGVRHLKISENIKEIEPEVVIIASAPMAAPGIKQVVPNAKVILWNHMRPDQPALQQIFNKNYRDSIDHIVYVSESQKSAFTEISPNLEGAVINNAISAPFENLFSGQEEILATKVCSGVYTSTPYRGLAILSEVKELPIDVFSSMEVYQGVDTPYQAMYSVLRQNDCLRLHGSVGQNKLAQQIRPASFMVYPSIFVECNSIAILEAMAAGLKVVTTDVAWPQTEFVDSMPSKGATVEDYTKLLRKNINFFRAHPEEWAAHIWKQVQYVNAEWTWRKRAQEWTVLLQNLLTTPT